MLMDPEEPSGRVVHSPALPVFTTFPNWELPLSGPLTKAADTSIGADMRARQKARTKANRGRNRMGGKPKKAKRLRYKPPNESVRSLQG